MMSVYASDDGQVINIDLGDGFVHELDYRAASSLMRRLDDALETTDGNVALIKQYGTSNYQGVAYARHKEWFGEKIAAQHNDEGKRIYEEANKETT